MPKKIDPAVRERAVRLVAEHQGEYPSTLAACEAVARQVGASRTPRSISSFETVRPSVCEVVVLCWLKFSLGTGRRSGFSGLRVRLSRIGCAAISRRRG